MLAAVADHKELLDDIRGNDLIPAELRREAETALL